MNFVDYTLVRLADPLSRSAILDQAALQRLLAAAYDTDALTIEGPYQALFDSFSIGLALQRRTAVEGRWGEISDPQRHHLSLQFDATDSSGVLRVDALWQGAIVASFGAAGSRVESVSATWPDGEGIDAEIVAALGALPASAADLEAERRKRLLARWRAGALQPDALTDVAFDAWVRSVGASSVSDLMTRWPGNVAAGPIKIGFSAAGATPPSPQPLPVAAAILVRDQPLDLAGLLSDSRQVRQALLARGVQAPSDPAFASRSPVVVAWVVPTAVFDDDDWPGAAPADSAEVKNQKRRTAAERWLAAEAIGLISSPARTA